MFEIPTNTTGYVSGYIVVYEVSDVNLLFYIYGYFYPMLLLLNLQIVFTLSWTYCDNRIW